MQKKRTWLSPVVASAVLATAAAAMAAGPADGGGAVFGQALDFAVQLRLEAGAGRGPECFGAEVTVGDHRLPAAGVRVELEDSAADTVRVRVRTAQAIDEPVVDVLLNAGCKVRVSRRYVLFAQPPSTGAATAAAGLPAPAVAIAAGEAAAGADRTPDRASGAVAQGGHAPPRRAAARDEPSPARGERRGRRAPSLASSAPPAAQHLARRTAAAGAAGPRLRLEAAEFADPAEPAAPDIVDQALEAVALAASSARAAAVAAAAASARIAALESTVDALRRESEDRRQQAAALRAALQHAEEPGRWTLPLLLAVLGLAALAARLAWSRRPAGRERSREGPDPAGRAETGVLAPLEAGAQPTRPTAPIPFVTSELRLPAVDRARAAAVPSPAATPAAPGEPPTLPGPAADGADGPMQRTEVLPARGHADDGGRDVSIDELLDLEQQAEFFVVLGQDDAAIDLLVEHLRQTGGTSPLPYLKLLEIYRRSGNPVEYDRTRTRFNHRFNAFAPAWEADLQAGRTLESYPGVMPRLQQVWQRPLDAMAELEALLFRKSRGELFELPAYREVLLLYSLARDLLDREAADSGSVDLLLPMADGGEFSSTAPAPYLGLERDADRSRGHADERPTAPLDFDLSAEPERPTSIFDTLGAIAGGRRR